jgi:type VI secretion system protein ImpE
VTAEQLFRAGQLDEAVSLLSEELREFPTDDRRRTFLVELLCLNGRWDRATKLLDGMEDSRGPNKVIYGQVLRAEGHRRAFLLGDGNPRVLGDAIAGLDLAPYQEAAQALERGESDMAFAVLDEAERRRPRVSGQRERSPFSDVRDADDRFAAVLEVLDGEEYAWLPYAALRSLQVQPPRHPIDFVFSPAILDDGKGPRRVFIPTRYPGSERAPEVALRMGWQTTTLDGAGVRCLGQRVLLIDDQIVPLLQLESLWLGPTGPQHRIEPRG